MRVESVTIHSWHPLVGTWVEKRRPCFSTSVAYTITAKAGRFHVSAMDESDAAELRVSDTSWDGQTLRFVTVFAPTKHKAYHEFWMTDEDVATHTICYFDACGDHTVKETWTKREYMPRPTSRAPFGSLLQFPQVIVKEEQRR